MKNTEKENFYKKLLELKNSKNIEKIFETIENNISLYAKKLYEARAKDEAQGSLIHDWWSACSKLLINRQLVISDVNFDDRSERGEEFIEIHNRGPLIVDISGLSINAGDEGQDFIFPEHAIMHPHQKIKIYTHRNESFSFHSVRPIWNNKGDIAYLYDREGILISSWAYGKPASEHVKIKFINYDGEEKKTEGDEFFEIENSSLHQIDVSQWKLSSNKNQVFTFPIGASIPELTCVRIYTNFLDIVTGGYTFNSSTAIWNNKGDSGKLEDSSGALISTYSY